MSNKKLFADWLYNIKQLSSTSIKRYVNVLNNYSITYHTDIFSMKNSEDFKNIKIQILNHPDFQQKNTIGHSMYSSALNRYEEFLLTQYNSTETLIFSEEIQFQDTLHYLEGSQKTITINAYERNPTARKKCIEHYGTCCSICGMDFGEIYGTQFSGIIHVHHLIPLSEISKEYIVNPITDLIPVCPNCHTIIHQKPNGIYTLDEVKTMLHNKSE